MNKREAKKKGVTFKRKKENPKNEQYLVLTEAFEVGTELWFGTTEPWQGGSIINILTGMSYFPNIPRSGDTPNILSKNINLYRENLFSTIGDVSEIQKIGGKRKILKLLSDLNRDADGGLVSLIDYLRPKKIKKPLKEEVIEERHFLYEAGTPLCIYDPETGKYHIGYFKSNGHPNSMTIDHTVLAVHRRAKEPLDGKHIRTFRKRSYYDVGTQVVHLGERVEIIEGIENIKAYISNRAIPRNVLSYFLESHKPKSEEQHKPKEKKTNKLDLPTPKQERLAWDRMVAKAYHPSRNLT